MLLAATDVSKLYGEFRVLDRVSFEVPDRGLVGIVGTNGAGKSTLFAAVSGQLSVESGNVAFDGREITRLSSMRRAQRGLGRTFQVPREFKHLSVRENLLAAAPREYGETLRSVFIGWGRVSKEEATLVETAERWMAFLNLKSVADQLAVNLSGGQKKLLELGRVLMLNPKCILLDEPFAGVNPVLIDEISNKIRELNASQGIAFVIIEHHLEALKAIVRHLYVMDQGRVIADGDPVTVLDDPRVHEAYMGGVI
ncbi:MAG: ABC transporter ATP-binding protein [Betaproteobacteria bacterium]